MTLQPGELSPDDERELDDERQLAERHGVDMDDPDWEQHWWQDEDERRG